jgi:hypothetical protein
MNDTELRERFAQWTDPLRAAAPPPVATIRRRARRRAANLAVTTGLVLAVVGLTAGLVASGLVATARPRDAGPWGSARYPAPPGQPYVLVVPAAVNGSPIAPGTGAQCFTQHNQDPLKSEPCPTPSSDRTELRDAATGAVLDVLRPTVRGASYIAAAAAQNDRLFVLAEQALTGQLTLVELRITVSDGTVSTQLTPVLSRVNITMGSQPISMTLNAAGTRLALSTAPIDNAQPSSLNVYDLSTGTLMESWRPPGVSISSQQFIGGADELAVFWPTSGPVVTPAASGSGPPTDIYQPLELRLVNTATAFPRRSSLLADSRADPAVNGEVDGSFSLDGSVALNTDVGGLKSIGAPPGPTSGDLRETDAVSGRLLWSVPLGPYRQNTYCGVLWASANGRDLLTQCGTRQLSIINGKARVVHLAWMFPAGGSNVISSQSTDGGPTVYREYSIASFAW